MISLVKMKNHCQVSVTYLDETPEYFVNVEAYESGNGHMFVMCISNKSSFDECMSQN
ncbi:hypothetical protein IFVP203_C2200020 [Vibrio parahaemolyticus]